MDTAPPTISEARREKLKLKAAEAVLYKLYLDEYTHQQDRALKGKGPITEDHPDYAYYEKRRERAKSSASTHAWITVNARDGTSLAKFKKLTEQAIDKTWIEDCIYNYEQKGETLETMGHGPHVHILIVKGKKAAFEIRREFKSTFKTICDVDNKGCLHFDWSCDPKEIKSWENYVNMDKADPDKRAKMDIDEIWRDENDMFPKDTQWTEVPEEDDAPAEPEWPGPDPEIQKIRSFFVNK